MPSNRIVVSFTTEYNPIKFPIITGRLIKVINNDTSAVEFILQSIATETCTNVTTHPLANLSEIMRVILMKSW